jgi:hypothetical protein
VSLSGRNALAQGQQRLCAIQGLDLGLLVEADDGGGLTDAGTSVSFTEVNQMPGEAPDKYAIREAKIRVRILLAVLAVRVVFNVAMFIAFSSMEGEFAERWVRGSYWRLGILGILAFAVFARSERSDRAVIALIVFDASNAVFDLFTFTVYGALVNWACVYIDWVGLEGIKLYQGKPGADRRIAVGLAVVFAFTMLVWIAI